MKQHVAKKVAPELVPEETGLVMVCVTRQRSCERLIELGARLAAERTLSLAVVHVVSTNERFMGNPSEGEALDALFTVAKQYGAEVAMLRSEHVVETLVDFARDHGARLVLLGQPKGDTHHVLNISREFTAHLPQTEIMVVDGS